ncbi:MAG: hypothetical protein SCK29_02290 [Bacillota bacterium]|nr:hypothetical protein [Bacillota bacterium]MDW7682931.1 hypothetical protein [Bacillota bacterium]
MEQKENYAYLLMQQSLRQLDTDRQVLQALQQAMAALQQAQQAVLADMKFHENLSRSGDYTELAGMGLQAPFPEKQDGQVPPWLSGRPPNLQ